jgi:hypothetical protein
MVVKTMNVESFNRNCRIAALIWLTVGVSFSFKYRPVRFDDFGQFYMGGLIARHHAWKALYPTPHADSPYNPGETKDATPNSEFQSLRDAAGVPGDLNFIQSPPTALLLEPLTLGSYRHARWAWIVLCGLCAWGIAVIGGNTYCFASGRTSRVQGAITVFIASSYMVYSCLRAINCEAIVALSLGLAIVAIMRRQPWRGAIAVVLGTLLKYATIILLPLLIACRRWRMAAASLLLVGASLAITWGVCGNGPFYQFIHDIMPRLGRAYEDSPNQSLVGFLMRVRGQVPLAGGLSAAAAFAACAALLGIMVLLFRIRPSTYDANPVLILAGAAALIAWLLIFSPLVWNKYFVFLCPLWGWLGWEATQGRRRLILTVAIIACIYGPWHMLGSEWSEPLNSHMLWGTMLVLVLAAWRLWHPASGSSTATILHSAQQI